MMKITLVRHTRPDVAPATCYGRTDLQIAPSFPVEAAATACAIKGINYDRVYSSPLQRALVLARYCCPSDKIIVDPDLQEMDFGQWEMKRYDSIDDPRLQAFYDDYLNYRVPGGESFADLRRRVDAFIDRLPSGCHPLIFTHGGVIASMLISAGVVAADQPFANAPGYGSVTTITL